VFANDCTVADAWGTAFMVMGHEAAIKYLSTQHELDALLMYTDEGGLIKTFSTPGIEPYLNFNP
jgi:thiamine biosynthesis lipoprotein